MAEWKDTEIKIKIKGPVGVAKPFKQGKDGVWRLTIPKEVVKENNLEVKTKGFFAYVFVDTDKGLLLVPLSKMVNPSSLREALDFIDISNLTDEDLEILFKEE